MTRNEEIKKHPNSNPETTEPWLVYQIFKEQYLMNHWPMRIFLIPLVYVYPVFILFPLHKLMLKNTVGRYLGNSKQKSSITCILARVRKHVDWPGMFSLSNAWVNHLQADLKSCWIISEMVIS